MLSFYKSDFISSVFISASADSFAVSLFFAVSVGVTVSEVSAA